MAQQPTREQFEAAAHRVIATAPAGLSREQFFDLIDKELSGSTYHPEMSILALGRASARGDNPPPQHEPDTWMGGFLKSIGDQVGGAASGMMERMAHPQNMGDFLSLLLPIGAKGAINTERAMVNRVKDAAAQAPRLRNIPKVMGDLAKENAAAGGRGARVARDLPLGEKMSSFPDTPAPVRGRFPGPPPRQEVFNDLPLHKQMDYMGETPAPETTRSGGPPISNLGHETTTPSSPGEAPRLAGQAPKLEDVLQQALEEAIANGDSSKTMQLRSLTPDIETAGEGATSQTGTFKRSEKLGQPGGYSSGRPSLTQQQYDDLLKRKGMESPPEPPPGGEGGGGPTTLDEALVEHDPGALASRAQDLRSQLGSRDAARSLFGTANPMTQGAVRTMAPGPSRLPTEAQRRIEEAILKALEGEGK